MLALLGVVLAFLLGAVNAGPAAVRPPLNAGGPQNMIVFGGSDQAAGPVKPRTIVCMLKHFLNAPAAPGTLTAPYSPSPSQRRHVLG
jgi:hypothetical protein